MITGSTQTTQLSRPDSYEPPRTNRLNRPVVYLCFEGLLSPEPSAEVILNPLQLVVIVRIVAVAQIR